MNCSQIRDLLPDYSVKILSGREMREVETHLTQCEGCRLELKAQDDAIALVERFGAINPPPGLFNAVRNRIESGQLERERPAWWAFLFTRPARAGAMGLAVAAVAAGLFLPVGSPAPTVRLDPHRNDGVVTSEVAQSIRQHALSAGQGTLTDRVAWEAMAQLVQPENAKRTGAKRSEVQ